MAAAAALTLVVTAGPAAAHAELASTEPAAGEELDAAPNEIVLHYTEGVDLTDGSVRVLDADGEPIDAGEAEHPGGDRAVVAAALPDLDDGTYIVAWRVVSSDSHPISGAFTFRVGDAGPASAADDQALIADVLGGSQDRDNTLGAVYGVVRFLAFAGVTVLVGALVFVTFLWPAGRTDRRARRIIRAAWIVAVVATVLSVPLQAAYATGGTLGDALSPDVAGDELGTRTGRAWLVRLCLLAIVAWLVPRWDAWTGAARRAAVAGGGLALLATVSVTGHAVSGDLVPLAFVTDLVHLAGVSVWLGGLALLVGAVLIGAGRRHGRRDEVDELDEKAAVDVVGRFSPVAFGAVVAIVVSGLVQSWRQLGGLDALFDTTYGRLLIVKVLVVAAMLVAAAFSRSWLNLRARGAVERDAGAPAREAALSPGPGAVAAGETERRAARLATLRRSVGAEVALAVVVLAVTALLVNAVPGETAAGAGGGGPFSTQIAEDDVVLTVEIDPAEVGPAAVQLYLNTPGGGRAPAEEATATLTLPEQDLGPLDVHLVDFGSGHWSSDGTELPLPGEWELEVIVRTSDIDETRFTTTFDVSP